jgi:hypothetical protein
VVKVNPEMQRAKVYGCRKLYNSSRSSSSSWKPNSSEKFAGKFAKSL